MKAYFFLITFLLFLGCTREEVDPSDYLLPVEEGMEIIHNEGIYSSLVCNSPEMNRYLLSVTENEVIYDATVEGNENLQPGRVIMANPSKVAENGFMRYIVERNDAADQIILTTRPADFHETFDQLNLSVKYHTVGKSIFRGPFEIEKAAVADLPIPIGSSGFNFDCSPLFGLSGDFIYEINMPQGSLPSLKAGVQDLVISLGAEASYEGDLTGEGALDYPLNLPFVMAIPIGQWVITINTRVVFNAKASVTAKGRITGNFTVENQPIDLVAEIDPNKYQGPTYSNITYLNNNQSVADLNTDAQITEAHGEIEAYWGLPINLEMAPYGAFDVSKVYMEFDLLSIVMNSKTETVMDKFQVRTKMDLNTAISMGVEVELIEKIFKKGGPIQVPVGFKFEAFKNEFPLNESIYCFPCEVDFTASSMETSCVDNPNGQRVEYQFSVNSNNGSPSGYRFYLDGTELGTYAYNQTHKRSIDAVRVKNVSTVTIQDVDNPGCRLEWKLVDACDLTANCDKAPFTDARDGQEYCTMVLADGREWLSSNVTFADGGGLGFCHSNDADRCAAIGRYYLFEDALNTACPQGFHLPSVAEWQTMLKAESASGLYRLLLPYVDNFGNLDPANTNGFNLIPAGQYQSWIFFGEAGSQFTGSIFDDGIPQALYWTSTEVEDDQKVELFKEGAFAMSITPSGYIKVATPKTTGLVCRCIKN